MKITISLTSGSAAILKAYAAYGIVGDTVEETAAFLLMRELGDICGTQGFHHLLEAAREDALQRKASKLRTRAPVESPRRGSGE